MKSARSITSPAKLSVAMIVRDEQEVLAETLSSVQPLVDEIVVLDTGSTDRTVELANEFGATVHCKPWANDFSAARNHCQRFVTGNWVLWINAGEVLPSECILPLREFVQSSADSQTAYSLWIESQPLDPFGAAQQRTEIRLLPTSCGLRFSGRVRESLLPVSIGSAPTKTPWRLTRKQSENSVERARAKAERNWALANREAESGAGWLPRLALTAGEAQSVLRNFDRAREMFRQVLDDATASRAERLEAHYGLLSTFDYDPELHASQLTACLDALEAFPFDLQLLLALGNYMLVRERLDLALRSLDAAVRFGEVTDSVWHLCELREIAAICLSSALQARQDDAAACQALETALESSPGSHRLASQLATLCSKMGRSEQAQALNERFALAPAAVQRVDGPQRQTRTDTRPAGRAGEASRRQQPIVT